MKKILIITTVILTLFAYSCDSSPPAVGGGTENPPTIVDPDNPGTTDPDNPGTTDPDNPGTTDPDNPGTTDPDNPGTTDPDNPGTTDPETPSATITITKGDGLYALSDTVQLSCSPEISGITWTSSNSDLIEVSSNGLVSQKTRTAATAIQDVTITAQSNGVDVGNITIPVGDYSYDESTSTYHIYSELGLNYWAGSVDVLTANVTLERDIALTQVKDTNGSTWNSVGTGSSSTGYAGIFDGKNHTISGLKVIRTDSSQRYGLFRVVTGTVKNLILDEVYIDISHGNAGGIAGKSYGTIENCTVSGEIKSNNLYAGGIAGYAEGIIKDCINHCSIVVKPNMDPIAGGIVGYGYKCKISGCSNYGAVTSNGFESVQCGGIAGRINNSSEIDGCFNYGDIKGINAEAIKDADDSLNVGGIVGLCVNESSTVTNCKVENATLTIYATYGTTGLNGYSINKFVGNMKNVDESNTGTAIITDVNSSTTTTV